MAVHTNLAGLARAAYTAAGVVLILFGFFGVDSAWAHYLLPSLGGLLLIEGLIGYSVAFAILGIGREEVK